MSLTVMLIGLAIEDDTNKPKRGCEALNQTALARFGRCAEVFCLSFPQTFFSQATGSEGIVANLCSGRRDVLANPFSQEIGSIGHDYSPDYAALASSFVGAAFAPFYVRRTVI